MQAELRYHISKQTSISKQKKSSNTWQKNVTSGWMYRVITSSSCGIQGQCYHILRTISCRFCSKFCKIQEATHFLSDGYISFSFAICECMLRATLCFGAINNKWIRWQTIVSFDIDSIDLWVNVTDVIPSYVRWCIRCIKQWRVTNWRASHFYHHKHSKVFPEINSTVSSAMIHMAIPKVKICGLHADYEINS